MRTRMYGGVRGRKTKVGGKSTFVFLLLDSVLMILPENLIQNVCKAISCIQKLLFEERRKVIYELI